MNKPTDSFIKPPQQQLNDLLEHYQHKRFNEAEKSYRKAIELKPDYVEALTNLGSTMVHRMVKT
jgi:tetratricopeptide (TPR) repeat protein